MTESIPAENRTGRRKRPHLTLVESPKEVAERIVRDIKRLGPDKDKEYIGSLADNDLLFAKDELISILSKHGIDFNWYLEQEKAKNSLTNTLNASQVMDKTGGMAGAKGPANGSGSTRPPSPEYLKLEDIFSSFKAEMPKDSPYFIADSTKIPTLNDQTLKGLGDLKPYYTNIELAPGGSLLHAKPNQKISSLVKELSPYPRFREAVGWRDLQSAQLAVSAVSAPTPKLQAAHFKVVSESILRIHGLKPDLLYRWRKAQEKEETTAENGRKVSAWDILQAEDNNSPGEQKLFPDNHMDFRNLWRERRKMLEEGLNKGVLTTQQLKELDILARVIDLPQLLRMVKEGPGQDKETGNVLKAATSKAKQLRERIPPDKRAPALVAGLATLGILAAIAVGRSLGPSEQVASPTPTTQQQIAVLEPASGQARQLFVDNTKVVMRQPDRHYQQSTYHSGDFSSAYGKAQALWYEVKTKKPLNPDDKAQMDDFISLVQSNQGQSLAEIGALYTHIRNDTIAFAQLAGAGNPFVGDSETVRHFNIPLCSHEMTPGQLSQVGCKYVPIIVPVNATQIVQNTGKEYQNHKVSPAA